MIGIFSNFWCNVSSIKLGPNVPQETLKVITDALKKYCEPQLKQKKPKKKNATVAQG